LREYPDSGWIFDYIKSDMDDGNGGVITMYFIFIYSEQLKGSEQIKGLFRRYWGIIE